MMKNAKAIAGENGKLIVGILTDKATMEKKTKPTLSLRERMGIAEAIKYVDLVVAQDTYSPLNNVISIKPDILMESASHDFEEIEEMKTEIKALGLKTKILQLPYYPLQSSTEIKKKIRKKEGKK
jgi:glycerol-3-phosphate cytidylyltransferase-like family protein